MDGKSGNYDERMLAAGREGKETMEQLVTVLLLSTHSTKVACETIDIRGPLCVTQEI
jgi:hypothetical protein